MHWSFKDDPDGVALEEERLDEWSDIDFFAIVRKGSKQRFLDDPCWLDRCAPVAYRFRNTKDGFKLLWADGIFGEMAVFESQELEAIPYSEGKVWWHREGFDPEVLKPKNSVGHAWTPPSPEFCAGELLTCLHVGLCRWNRGERLSAWSFLSGWKPAARRSYSGECGHGCGNPETREGVSPACGPG